MLELVDQEMLENDDLNESLISIAREIAADLMDGDVENDQRTATFEGTRWECEAFLDSYYSIQRNIVLGAQSKAPEDERPKYDDMLDLLDRRVYIVMVRPIGMAVGSEPRPENAYRAMRIQTALEIFDALLDGRKGR